MIRHSAFAFMLASAVGAIGQNSYTALYTAGDILSDKTFQTLPGVSICPVPLSVNVPLGEYIDSALVTYDFFSSMAGFGSPAQQRSWIRCTTTGVGEAQMAYAGAFIGNTASYSRTITVANGLSTGVVEFEMHPGTTGLFGANCTDYHFIPNNTWSISVYTHASSLGLGVQNSSGMVVDLSGDRVVLNGLAPGEVAVDVFDGTGRLIGGTVGTSVDGSMTVTLPPNAHGICLLQVRAGSSSTVHRLLLE